MELMEALHDDVFWHNVFDSHHVEEHVVAQVERGVQGVALALEDVLGHLWLKLLVCHQDSDTLVVEASTTGTSRHLDILAARDPPVLITVELLDGGEDNCLSRHVDAHREGFCGEEDLDQTVLEEKFDDLLDYWQKATMMDTNTSL